VAYTSVHNRIINKLEGVEYRNQTVNVRISKCYNMNNKLVNVIPPGYWRGRRCFILGGGPSLLNFDYSKLKNELTIGINKSFEYYSDATINYSMDSSLYDKIIKKELDGFAGMDVLSKWKSFKGIRVFITPIAPKKFGDEVHIIKKVIDKVLNSSLDEGVYGGSNSATGALMLAATLGASPIYLLGYDMRADLRSHWHEGYADRDMVHFRNKLAQYCTEITSLEPILTDHNVQVINLNRNSNLKCFPFDDLENVLK